MPSKCPHCKGVMRKTGERRGFKCLNPKCVPKVAAKNSPFKKDKK